MRDKTYYLDKIPSMNRGQPSFTEMLSALLEPVVKAGSAADALPQNFDIDQAVGAQLDQVGLWVGLLRQLPVPLTDTYFSFDSEGLGFDEGVWWAAFDPETETVSLPDDVYRVMLKLKVRCNYWDGSLEGMQSLWQAFLTDNQALTGAPTALGFVQDNQNMTALLVAVSERFAPIVQRLAAAQLLPLKPFGVRLSYLFVVGSDRLFAFDTDNAFLAGFDAGIFFPG